MPQRRTNEIQFSQIYNRSVFLLLLSCQKKPFEVILLSSEKENSVDVNAMYHFLEKDERFLPGIMRLPNDSARLAVNQSAVYWLHLSDTSEYVKWNMNPANLIVLKQLYGRSDILLSGYAALLPYRLGIEIEPPEVKKLNIEDDWSFDQRGLQSWQGHTVFNGLFGGCFLWDAYQNHTLTRIGYFDDRLLRDFQAGLIKGDSVLWLDTFEPRIEIPPESLTRYYDTPAGRLKEILFPSLTNPAMTVRYELIDSDSIRLFVRLRSNLRWMWPYDEHALGAVHYGYDNGQDALHIKDKSGRFYVLIGSLSRATLHLTGSYKNINYHAGELLGDTTILNQVSHAAVYTVKDKIQFTAISVPCVASLNSFRNFRTNRAKYFTSFPLPA